MRWDEMGEACLYISPLHSHQKRHFCSFLTCVYVREQCNVKSIFPSTIHVTTPASTQFTKQLDTPILVSE
jgi:hypothetical protein